MAKDWCKHKGDRILLVEGANDCHVVLALCAAYAVPETFGIYECSGDFPALDRMYNLIKGSIPYSAIGLVLDADRPDVTGRWQSIRDRLEEFGYSFPLIPAMAGTIVEPKIKPERLGFWLMPNNRDIGMLEDFYIGMIEAQAVTTAE